MAKVNPKFNPQQFLAQVGNGKTTLTCPKKQILFSQGDAATAVFYVQTGKVRLSVTSSQGQEAIIGILEPGAFSVKGVSLASWCAWSWQPL
jgi:CRP/FNR family transcriptional regulator, cyclic AMP receptor protein